jgi:3-(methylthio)propanoyl-CoA dehydrogenase
MNSYSDSAEWKYLFKNCLDWQQIIPLYTNEDPKELIPFYEELLSNVAEWSSNTLAPRAKELDKEGAGTLLDGKTIPGQALSKSYAEANELGFFSLFIEPHYGGQGIPVTVGSLMYAHIFKACIPTGTQLSFYTSIADMIERFCDEQDKERLLPQFVAGTLSGAMCLTEPGAGSDVGSLRTSATKQADGTYLINGSKIFITNGGGGVCFVLARTKDAPKGLEGISLFLVEQGESNYRVAKIEEKMGFHGSFTCEVLFENSKAKLVGQENQGFKYMLHLMNEARLGVALQCLGGMEACLDYAKTYASTRIQFGRPIADLPLMKRNLKDWQIELDAFRALIVDTMSHYDIYQKLDLKKRHTQDLNKKEQEQLALATKWVRRRTPLVKYYGAETFTTLSQKTIQVLGGYGYMQEYEAERIHRDSFAPLLYEGTSQIQALMALKDLLKYVMKNPSKFAQSLVGNHPLKNLFTTNEVTKSFSALNYRFKKKLTKLLIRSLRPDIDTKDPSQIMSFFNSKNWLNEQSIEKVMIHAETLTQALSYLETLRVLAKHAEKDKSRLILFQDYLDLTAPRLEGIYTDWARNHS